MTLKRSGNWKPGVMSCRVPIIERSGHLILAGIVAAAAASAHSARGASVPECTATQKLAPANPEWAEVDAHRQFKLPVLTYPSDGRPDERWGVLLRLRIDATGRVACRLTVPDDGDLDATEQRRAVRDQISSWRYLPFAVDGKASDAFVYESIREQHLPERHVPLPAVPTDDVTIKLERTECFGSCPVYDVTIHGDGKVVYHGIENVDVTGRKAYSIPRADVERLVANLRANDFWSMDAEYVSQITDVPSTILTITVAGQEHRILDYAGRRVGMPEAVTEFQRNVDEVARSEVWIAPGHRAQRRLLKATPSP